MSTPVSPAPARPVGWTLQAVPAPASVDHIGELFAGRYLMRRRIGGGGMSTIYEAKDTHLGTRVAVKIMRADLPIDPVDRFRREAHVLAALTHEHIARILDRQDPEEGPRFLVTELIDGIDLSKLRRRGALTSAVVLQIGLQATAALAHVHAAGVIHRDIKPSNLMLVRHLSGDAFLKVIDFGIAKLERGAEIAAPENAPPGARRETRGDVVIGTAPYYCGHEGPRRDVYALALTLAELLTGKSPDPGVTLAHADIPTALARVIITALRDNAMATMDAFHAALREADIQAPHEAEAARRRYVAQVFAKQPAATTTSPTADEAPRFAGRYIVSGELGQGGMGRVRTAFDPQNRRMVALKTISPRCAGMKSLEYRFRREARALAAIEHHGTPTLYESGSEPEHFFTMEIVEGVTLAATLKRGKIEPHRALGLAIGLGEILCAAHEVGVIHRDVKPDNIVISHGDRVRLLDFGACLLMPRFHQRHLLFPATPAEERYATGELEAVGTPGYSAPEVLSLDGGSGPRSDVYSVCAVLYEMLTGRPLVDRATRRTHVVERHELPASLASVADLLRQGSELEPSDRVWTMNDLVRGLEIARGGLTHARERRRLASAVGLAVLSTAAIVSLGAQFLARAPTISQDAAALPTTGVAVEATPTPLAIAPSPAAASIGVAPPPAVTAPPVLPNIETPHRGGASTPPAPPATDSDALISPVTGERPVALTRALVESRIAARASQLKTKCAVKWIAVDVTITRGRAKLTAVNGMPFSTDDPTHTCVREQLQQLTFPAAAKAAQFSLTIDLNRRAPRGPR